VRQIYNRHYLIEKPNLKTAFNGSFFITFIEIAPI
jgi:hypothetical protein